MKKLFLLFAVVCLPALAQNFDQPQGFGTSGQAIRFDVKADRGARRFEYVYGGSLSTVSTVLKGCMRGDTCDTIETSTSTSNTNRCVNDIYDYYTVTPTFTGGTAPTLTVNMTSGPSARCSSGALASGGQAVHGINSAGGGFPAAAILGEADDASTSACTENQFCAVRVGLVSRSLLIGGSTAPTAASSTVVPLAVNSGGALAIGSIVTPTNAVTIASNVVGPIGSSGSSVSAVGAGLLVVPRVYNGSTVDLAWYCNKVAKLSALAAATTQIVALSGTTKIYVCSAVISNNNATPTTLKFVEGTGSNCGTGTADLSALMNIGATTTSPISIQYGASGALSTATAGDALCMTSSAASSLEITLTYQQF
jgi:hypothetical protein